MKTLRSLLCFVLAVALALPAQATAFLSPVVKVHEPEDAFGNLTFSSGTTTNGYQYCGEQYDADLGLYYLRARYLNPDSGRFWSADAFEGMESDPMSLHKYLYANVDPVGRVDPSGYLNMAELNLTMFTQSSVRLMGAAAARFAMARAKFLIYGLVMIVAGGQAFTESQIAGEYDGRKRELIEEAMRVSPQDNAFAVAARMRNRSCATFVSSRARYRTVADIDSMAQQMGRPSRVHVGPRGTPVWESFKRVNRRLAMAASGLLPRSDKERHEYPYAVMLEGGAKAHVDYADPQDNSSHGADVGNFLEALNLRLGDCVDIIVTP